MDQNLTYYIKECFEKLVEKYNFKLETEINEGNSYLIVYYSPSFIIEINKYFREFYPIVHKKNKPDDAINLFNLLEFLTQPKKSLSEYFRKENSIEASFRKQFFHITSLIYGNYALLNDFFTSESYDLKLAEFTEYWKNKHPELYGLS